MVSSGRLGLGLGDSQELKNDWMKGSRCCPFWWRKGITLIKHCTVAKRPPTRPCMHTHPSSAWLTSFISLLGTDLMIFPAKHKHFISVMYCFPTTHHHHRFTQTQGRAAQTSPRRAGEVWPSPTQSITSIRHTLTVPRFTSGSILSRNWDSVLLGDRKSASSWLLLSSGCCRSFWRGNAFQHVLTETCDLEQLLSYPLFYVFRLYYQRDRICPGFWDPSWTTKFLLQLAILWKWSLCPLRPNAPHSRLSQGALPEDTPGTPHASTSGTRNSWGRWFSLMAAARLETSLQRVMRWGEKRPRENNSLAPTHHHHTPTPPHTHRVTPIEAIKPAWRMAVKFCSWVRMLLSSVWTGILKTEN